MESVIKNIPETITLCRQGSCCPTLTKTESEYILKDDYNGSVRLTEDQLTLLKDSIDYFKNKSV